jgi:hypothetical protein
MGCSDSFEKDGVGKVELQDALPNRAELELAMSRGLDDSYERAMRDCKMRGCPPNPRFHSGKFDCEETPLENGKRFLVCKCKIEWTCSMAPRVPDSLL